MNRQTALQAKETGPLRKNRSSWLRHAAVRPVAEAEHEGLSGGKTGGLAVDLTSVPVRPQMQTAGQAATRSCPMSPQRCPFGGACHSCPPRVQAKLKIGQPGDRYEQEADRVAETVMRMPEPSVQRKCSAPGCKDEDEDKLVQTKSAGSAGNAQVDHPLIQSVLSSPGQPLDAGTRSFMEPRFGQDFSGVRVHVGGQAAESARAVNARAYTVGRDVVFGEGQYAPGSGEGRRLVAHELAHVGQQNVGSVQHVLQRQPDSIEIGKKYVINTPKGGNLLLRVQPTQETVLNGDRTQPNTVGNVRSGTVVLIKEARLYDWYVVEAKTIEHGVRVGFVQKKHLQPVVPGTSVPKETLAESKASSGSSMGEIIELSETVPHQGDPLKDQNYIENSTKGIGIPIWGGPLYLKQTSTPGWNDCVVLPRKEIAFVDPLSKQQFEIMSIYRTREAALKAVQQMGVAGAFTFYVGPMNRILPTIVSATTAPKVTNTVEKAIEGERKDARAAEQLSIQLLLWYIGARYPVKIREVPAATQMARSSLAEILGDTEYVALKAAAEAAKQANPKLASLTIDEIIAIRAYSAESWSYLNAALRLKDAKELTRLGKFIEIMKSGISKLPIYKGTTTRTIAMQVPEAAQKYKVGATVIEDAFTSTTFGKGVAQREGNILMTIESSTGRDISAIAVHNESEVLFAPGTKFIVTKVEQIGGAFLVWMKEVL